MTSLCGDPVDTQGKSAIVNDVSAGAIKYKTQVGHGDISGREEYRQLLRSKLVYCPFLFF